MLPYGIIIRENRLTLQQSFIIWQRKFGFLKADKFLKISLPIILSIMALSLVFLFVFDKNIDIITLLYTLVLVIGFSASYFYLSAMRTVREYAENTKERRVQVVLKEEVLEITTDFSKEVIPYKEIDCCFEKDFLVTLIYDKKSFPLSIAKTNFEKGNYDVFVSLLKSKLPGRYEKKGEN